MFSMIFEATKVSIQIDRYTKTLDTAIKTQIRQGTRAWLREVIKHVPIWTGTAMSTYHPLAAALRVAIPHDSEVTRPGYGFSVGRAAQDFQFGRDGNTWFFEFRQELPYYLLNDNFDMSAYIRLRHKTPWNSIRAGDAAYEEYINKNLKDRIPSLNDFVLTVEKTRG